MPNTSRPPAGRFLYRVRLCYHLDGAGDFRRIADYGLRGPTGFARENLRGAQAWAIDKVAALAGGTSFWLRTLRPAAYECLGPLLARLAGGTYSIFGSFDAAGGPAPKPGEEVQATFEGLIWSDQAGVELLAAGVNA